MRIKQLKLLNLESRDLSQENIINEKDPDLEGLMNNDWRSRILMTIDLKIFRRTVSWKGFINEDQIEICFILDSEIILIMMKPVLKLNLLNH